MKNADVVHGPCAAGGASIAKYSFVPTAGVKPNFAPEDASDARRDKAHVASGFLHPVILLAGLLDKHDVDLVLFELPRQMLALRPVLKRLGVNRGHAERGDHIRSIEHGASLDVLVDGCRDTFGGKDRSEAWEQATGSHKPIAIYAVLGPIRPATKVDIHPLH